MNAWAGLAGVDIYLVPHRALEIRKYAETSMNVVNRVRLSAPHFSQSPCPASLGRSRFFAKTCPLLANRAVSRIVRLLGGHSPSLIAARRGHAGQCNQLVPAAGL